MHTFNGFDGTERFCDGMKDDLGPKIFGVKINGKRMMRPQKESQRLKDLASRLEAGLKLRKRRGNDKWRLRTFAQAILGSQWASDNERDLANYVLSL